ncbi:hypothetical protein HUJ05_010383 [Dendroctonus ponderosae]|nr:hypothetical protein HUJ05_010383 [Dendroctonus ponderosae]
MKKNSSQYNWMCLKKCITLYIVSFNSAFYHFFRETTEVLPEREIRFNAKLGHSTNYSQNKVEMEMKISLLKMTSPALNNGNGQKESSNKGSNATLPQSPARSANEASGSSSSTSALVAPWRVFKMQLKGLLGVLGVDGMEPEEHRELGDFKLEPLNFLINRIGNDFRTIFSRIACEDWVGETESILQGKKNY